MSGGSVADESTEETPDENEGPKGPVTPKAKNPLSKDSDVAARPGFRSAANTGSKASKKRKKRKRK